MWSNCVILRFKSLYINGVYKINQFLVWDSTGVKSPSTFERSLAVNFQMSRSIDDNKPATPDMTLNRFNSPAFWRAADKTCVQKDNVYQPEANVSRHYKINNFTASLT